MFRLISTPSRAFKPAIIFSRCFTVPSTTSKVIPVYPPVEPTPSKGNLVHQLTQIDMDTRLDPDGSRRPLIDRHNKGCIKAGDIIRIVYDRSKCPNDNFVGYVLSLDRKYITQDSSVLLRTHVATTAVELRVPVFSPLINRIDILRRADPKRKRNKHYYIRNTRLDVGDLESSIRKKR